LKDWTEVRSASAQPVAELEAGLLREAGITTLVLDSGAVPGLAFGCSLLVPDVQAYRARALLARADIGTDELERLALATPPESDS
jgi:hypothetical protein